MFYSTPEECCAFFFTSQSTCKKVNRPNCKIDPALLSGGCTSDRWHPDEATRKGCSNSNYFPDEWQGQWGELLFSSAGACCEKYQVGMECAVRDGCTGEVTLKEITESPTKYPTKSPTPPVSLYFDLFISFDIGLKAWWGSFMLWIGCLFEFSRGLRIRP